MTEDDKQNPNSSERPPVKNQNKRGSQRRDSRSKPHVKHPAREHSSAPAETAPSGVAKVAGSDGRGMSVAALVVSLLALAAGGYSWYQSSVVGKLSSGEQSTQLSSLAESVDSLKSTQNDLTEQFSSLRDRVETSQSGFNDLINQTKTSVTDQLTSATSGRAQEFEGIRGEMGKLSNWVNEQLAGAKNEQAQQLEGFRTEFNGLTQSVQKLYQDVGRSVDSWAVEEVEQLLLLANHRLKLVGDAQSAASALRLADERLEKIGDPGLVDVRAAIANEVGQLDALPKIDIEGTALALAGLAQSVDQLPLAKDPEAGEVSAPQAEAAQPTEEQAPVTGRREKLLSAGKQLFKDLGSMVQVKNVEQTKAPSLAPKQEYFLYENLRLMLNGAQLALLRNNSQVYSETLNQAGAWLDSHFDINNEAVAKFKSQVGELAALNIRPELPDVSGSLNTLREILQNRGASS